MINRKLIVLAAITTITSFSPFLALAGGHGIMVSGAEMLATQNIIENASESADHTTLVAAVKAAQLVDLLQNDGPFTVLAPTNTAFEALPEGTVDNLLKPENLETLQTVLSCHVVAANAMAADVIKMIADNGGEHTIGAARGCVLVAENNDDKVTFTDEKGNVATVTIADVAQKNSVIHVIDTVLLPKS